MRSQNFLGLSARELKSIFLLFLVTRLAVVGIGLLANKYMPSPYGHEWKRLDNPLLDMWYRWDAGFYTAIGLYGYNFAANRTMASDIGFMPLYPATLRLALPLIGCVNRLCTHNWLLSCAGRSCAVVSGLLISNFALLLSAFFLYKLARQKIDEATAMRSVVLLMIAPNTIFLSGVYTESLFLLFALIVFHALSRDHFTLAVIAASLGCLTREVGLALYGPLVLYAWKQTGKRRLSCLFAAHIPPVVFAVYILGAGLLAGSWLAYFRVNADIWGASVANGPLGAFAPYLSTLIDNEQVSVWGAGPSWINLAATLVYLLLAIPAFQQDTSFGLFSLLAILIPITGGTLVSMPRFGAPIFPHYTVGAERANSRLRRFLLYLLFAATAYFFIVRFVTWHWAA